MRGAPRRIAAFLFVVSGCALALAFDKRDRLPSFDVVDIAGKHWTQKTFDGKTSVVVVWSSHCHWCVKDLPQIEALRKRYAGRKDRQVLTFAADGDPAPLRAILAKVPEFDVPVLLAGESLARVDAFPTTWIVDAQSVIRESFKGMQPDWAEDTALLADAVEHRGPMVRVP